VGYLEGWYVSPDWRRRGVGGRLIAAAEAWARRQGCREMASDTWIDNVDGQSAHEALGYEVVDRCVNYRKLL
jgi:aminoglycoside 6'-N-acetyltransferase I